MNKILIFYGPKSEFEKLIPNEYKNLTEIASEHDAERRELTLKSLENRKEPIKRQIKEFVVGSDEYASVNEHVITNFCNYISNFTIENLYIHNPPTCIEKQLNKLFADIVTIQKYDYPQFTVDNLKTFRDTYSQYIIGQDKARDEIAANLYSMLKNTNKKPLVLLFYGDSGIGKTETAKFLSRLTGCNLFRKQFSMLQNNQSFNYIYGGTHSEKCFAKDLLDRESNIILLDEFDKAYNAFHNAFYEMFDEGYYSDTNYNVELNKSIIICTSNYKNEDDIIKNLGMPIFSRFDAIIKFDDFSLDTRKQIIENCYRKIILEFTTEEQDFISKNDLLNKVLSFAKYLSNARIIEKKIRECISKLLITRL